MVCVKLVMCMSGIVFVVLYVILLMVVVSGVDLFFGIMIVVIFVVLVLCR